MVCPTMRIATNVGLMKRTLLTLEGLQPWTKMVIVMMLMCRKVHSPPWIEPWFACMKDVAEMIIECGEGASIKLCDHATSLFQRVASNIETICLIPVNESM